MPKLLDAATAIKIYQQWIGNKLGGVAHIKDLQAMYNLSEPTIMKIIRLTDSYKHYRTLEISKHIECLEYEDCRSLKDIDRNKDNYKERTLAMGNFWIYYIDAFAKRYLDFDKRVTQGTSTQYLKEAILYVYRNNLIDKFAVEELEGTISGPKYATIYHRLISEMKQWNVTKTEQEIKQMLDTQIEFQLKTMIRDPKNNWANYVDKFYKKSQGKCYFLNKKTQVFNTWMIKPELVQQMYNDKIIDILPTYMQD